MAYKYLDEINEAFFKAGRDGRNVNIELFSYIVVFAEKLKKEGIC